MPTLVGGNSDVPVTELHADPNDGASVWANAMRARVFPVAIALDRNRPDRGQAPCDQTCEPTAQAASAQTFNNN